MNISKEELTKVFPYGKTEYAIGNKENMFWIIRNSAYIDMQPRHFKNIGKKKDERDKIFCELVDKFCDYFKAEPMNEKEYDKWHKDLCNWLHDEFDKIGYSDILTRGKAQKLINMSMKQFYLFNNSDERYFEYAHFTLDTYTLIWYGVYCPVYDFFPDSWQTWGNFDDNVYETMQNEVRKYLSSPENTELAGISPFKAEFFIWKKYSEKFGRFFRK
ncbi:MAG: hypothetical protein K2K91_10510 [Ruminococcus sp.]|nr:hypothetical protein [Ruminococcus sp.]